MCISLTFVVVPLFVYTKDLYLCIEELGNKASLSKPNCVLHFIVMPHPRLTEMQHHELYTVQVSSAGSERAPVNLLRAFSRTAAAISQLHLEIAELKEALQEIIQALIHAIHCLCAVRLSAP